MDAADVLAGDDAAARQDIDGVGAQALASQSVGLATGELTEVFQALFPQLGRDGEAALFGLDQEVHGVDAGVVAHGVWVLPQTKAAFVVLTGAQGLHHGGKHLVGGLGALTKAEAGLEDHGREGLADLLLGAAVRVLL